MIGYTIRIGPIAVAIAFERIAAVREQARREAAQKPGDPRLVADQVAERLRRAGAP